jgi:hypothetical protein
MEMFEHVVSTAEALPACAMTTRNTATFRQVSRYMPSKVGPKMESLSTISESTPKATIMLSINMITSTTCQDLSNTLVEHMIN